MAFRSGFAAIIGRPNAGKSTLLNQLVGQKIAIVTHKAQTTRTRIQGYVNIPAKKGEHPAAQLILIDTPGIHQPDTSLGKRMMQEVRDALSDRDLVLFLVDATQHPELASESGLNLISSAKTPAILVLNKIDLVHKEKLLPLIDSYRQIFDFAEIVPVSAKKGSGLEHLLKACVRLLPEGPRYFAEDEVTDQPERFLAAEIIREKVLLHTGQEVPYSAAVVVERWEEPKRPGAATRIAAAIYCEREGQKGIIIGKNGALLKKIGTAARVELEKLLATKIFLELFVKVRENWRDSRHVLNELDWRQRLEALSASPPKKTGEG